MNMDWHLWALMLHFLCVCIAPLGAQCRERHHLFHTGTGYECVCVCILCLSAHKLIIQRTTIKPNTETMYAPEQRIAACAICSLSGVYSLLQTPKGYRKWNFGSRVATWKIFIFFP